jgi:cytochrome c biogenesis protein CcmG, thiol:disulfide interchange protein DsbE
MRKVARAGAVALVAALFGLLALHLVTSDRNNGLARAVAAGTRPHAPSFTLSRLDEPGRLDLASLRGRVVVLNFWASWCSPCKGEAGVLASASRRWQSRGVELLGVDSQDFSSDARSFMRRHGIDYPNLHDGAGSVMARYGVTGFPETWFITRRGRIVAHVDGQLTSATLDQDVRLALHG